MLITVERGVKEVVVGYFKLHQGLRVSTEGNQEKH